jgi:hypothetical protein
MTSSPERVGLRRDLVERECIPSIYFNSPAPGFTHCDLQKKFYAYDESEK